MDVGFYEAGVVPNLQPLVSVACKRSGRGDAGESHCAWQRAGCAVLRALRKTAAALLYEAGLSELSGLIGRGWPGASALWRFRCAADC
jgi:hypothetical protein